jgi:hypothetical protein
MVLPESRRGGRERGAALILVIFASTIVLLLLMTALVMTGTSGRTVARQLISQGQAMNVAAAGLTEATSWFVHQRRQPVVSFDPQSSESEAPSIGIVRSFEITSRGRVWGRYEVRRTRVADVSRRRGKTQDGMIWQIASVGQVYVRNDPSLAPNVRPNILLASRTMLQEVQRLGLQLPANAAVFGTRGNNINVVRPSRVQGGSSGIGAAYPTSTGTPRGNGTYSGNPAKSVSNGGYSLEQVFGVSQSELLGMADIVVDDERDLPNPLPAMSLIVIRGNATFNATRTLTGSGILVVLGNLNLNPQSDAYFSGIIWTGGNFLLSPPGTINGAVVSNGNVQVNGGSEVSEINYDSAIIDQIRQQMGNYIASRSPWLEGGTR